MKIEHVESIPLRIPYRHGGPYPLFGGRPRTTMDILLVRVVTDTGITGWGEAFSGPVRTATCAVIDDAIAPLALGRDPTAVNALMEDLSRKLQGSGRGGPTTFALSAFDIALWDIAGKAAGLPVHRLLGGARRNSMNAYASLLQYHDPDLVARNAAEAVGRGYRHVKIHEYQEPEIAASRAAVGDGIALMADTNCPWDLVGAIDAARKLAPYDLHWLEEPVWPPENAYSLAELSRAAPMPIAAGENARTLFDFRCMIDLKAVTVLQPSIGKMGGITEARKVLAMAEAAGVRVTPHCTYFGPAALATIHLLSTVREEPLLERFYCTLEASPFGDAVLADAGTATVPQGPGLGADPDPGLLRKYTSK